MKKLQLIIILLLIILLPVSSQKSKDALYLKNGSIIYGKLVEISENQYKMQTSDGSQFIYPLSDVEKYVKESPAFAGRKTEGFGFGLEAGFLVGAQNSNYAAPFSFNILGSYAVKTKYIVSLGSGVEFIGVPFSPVFLEFKYLLKEKKTTPFFFARSGALIHLGGDDDGDNYNNIYDKKNFKGGFSAALGTGVSWAKEDIEPYLSFAYRYAATSYQQRNYNEDDATYKNSYNRLEIKIGFRF